MDCFGEENRLEQSGLGDRVGRSVRCGEAGLVASLRIDAIEERFSGAIAAEILYEQ
jgi:hypothetical protein